MIDKITGNKKEDKCQINIKTEYIGNEETEYIHTTGTEYEDIEETEYQELYKNRASESKIINQRYKIVETLGKGGMGAVYKALDIRLRNTPVAIKEISLETIENERIEKVIENFENESETLIQLRHSSIPRVMDFFSLDDDKCYIVMDLIEGETLSQVVKRRGKIPENEVREWLNQLSDVLSYLHNRKPKIIFRDLKPSNVMITNDNEIKLIDFGIARTFKDDKNSDTSYYISQGFSPPEQYGTGQSDERSDIYSLGALLYSLLIGGKPKIKDFKFESLKNYTDVSDELNNAIMLATNFRPENRPKTIEEFINLLNYKETQKSNPENILKKKNKLNKRSKVIVGTIAIFIIILVVSKLNINKEDINQSNGEVVKNSINDKSAVENIEYNNSDKEDEGIKKAIEALYKANGLSERDVKYLYSPDANYVQEPEIKENYYIFIEKSNPDTDYETWGDYNMLVNKETFEVYTYYAGGPLEKYKKASEPQEESLYPDQADWKEECKKIHEPYGIKCMDSDTHQLTRRDLSSTGTSGERGNTSDIELTGVDWYKECKKLHDGQCILMDEHERNKYNMNDLYQEYKKYEFEKEDIDKIFSEGWLAGFNYVWYEQDQSESTIEEYIYINSPENTSGIIWEKGFKYAYDKYISKKESGA